LLSPTGDLYCGNNFSSEGYTVVGENSNDIDNVEGILISDPAAGIYKITINAVSIPSGVQTYALVVTGDLIGKAGSICFDKEAYTCVDTIIIRASDVDLADTGTLDVKVSSEKAGDEITFTLMELQPDTGIFSAPLVIGIDGTNNPDLIVEEMDTVIVSYIDSDDGMGHHDVEVKCDAAVDCHAPIISEVEIKDAGYDYITISWLTDEETKGEVNYSRGGKSQEIPFYEAAYSTIHAVRLDNLQPCTEYSVSISSADRSGNRTLDNNNGDYYRFNTLSQLLIHSGGELTGEGRWTLSDAYSVNGGYSWSSGYGKNQCNRLYTPYFFIPPDQPTYMTFWTIYDIEAGFDGGTVEVAADYSDNWEIVEPLFTGYPLISRDDTTSCIGQSVPCFSGKNDLDFTDWQKYLIDLTSYAGKAAAVSFLFGSDPEEEGQGWFIDQIEVWRNLQCVSIENNTDEPMIQCQTSENIYQGGDYLEGLLFYDNPKAEDLDVNVYCAIISGGSIFFFNGRNFVTTAEGFTKTFKGGTQMEESVFVFPIPREGLSGDYIFAAALTRVDSFELYGEISTYPFEIE
ncbi:immune inhibitor A, partial [bacterium]|nr:immune inhibitor A [bacterium]